MTRITGYWYSPRKSIIRTRNRQIFLHIAFKIVQNFLVSSRGVYEIWVALDVAEELVTEGRQAEHVVFFLSPLDWGPGLGGHETGGEIVACRGDLRDLGVRIETFVCDGIPSRVLPFIYETFLPKELLFVGEQ